MIPMAIDTAVTIARALLAWLAILAAVITVALFTTVLTGAWAWQTVAASVKVARAWLSWRLRDFEAPEVDGEGSGAPEPSSAHTAPPAPSWARADKEAA